MITPAVNPDAGLPKALTHCVRCEEPLYAGFPMRSVPGGAMHVGCWVLHRNAQAHRHLELVVDNTGQPPEN